MGTVVIVDNHPLIRLAVRMMLEKEGHTVAAEIDNGADAIPVICKVLPDLVILDLSIPRLDGFSVILHFRSIGLQVKMLVLSAGDSKRFAVRSLQAGANGFICKDDNLDKLVGAVKAVLSGRTYFPASVVCLLQQDRQAAYQESTLVSRLTDREITILKLLASGMGNQEIAFNLMISHKTVSTYRVRLLRKLNVTSLVALVELAKRNEVA